MTWAFDPLEKGKYRAILADPPWRFQVWSDKGRGNRATEQHYSTMEAEDIATLPVEQLAASDCVLFLWLGWPYLPQAMRLIHEWGFTYMAAAKLFGEFAVLNFNEVAA